MKYSKFNTIVPFEDNFVYHNSFTQRFLLLKPLLIDLIEASKSENNIEELKIIHPDLFNSLIENGFLVPKEQDEIQKVQNMMQKIDGRDDSFYLIVNTTMNCNFSCWYCYESHIKNSKLDKININKIKKFVEITFAEKSNLKLFTLSFFGGEPLLFFDDAIIPVIENTSRTVQKYGATLQVGFTTNGLLINERIIKALSKYKISGFQISFDGNKEHHDQTRFVSKSRGSYDEIMANVKLIVRNGMSVTLRINYTAKNLPELSGILIDLDELKQVEKDRIVISMNKVWQEENRNLWGSVKEFYQKAEQYGLHSTDALAGDTVRNSCYADKINEAVINYNGDVYKCNARDFKSENRDGYLADNGSISWGKNIQNRLNIKLKNKPCLDCTIMPICGGGCTQVAWENRNRDYCVNDFDESRKKEIVLEMFHSKRLEYV
ncbi:radical SAM protein [Myroides odoratus]|uniref:radical SAM protein n=1 Tax=Myroides odoratus TaxID=256 RepID=UPI0039AF11D5